MQLTLMAGGFTPVCLFMTKGKHKNRRLQAAPPASRGAVAAQSGFPTVWLAGLIAISAFVYGPMLMHQFTNWDDEAYVVNNALLHGPDWKGIFTQPVVSNYHPLTILSLALNYQVSHLQPFTYFLINLLLHLLNTSLVFYFVWLISGKERWVASFTALVFALHPMHVESVAWISERKDVLYTVFYLLALIRYWRFLELGKRADLWWTFGCFLLSLLAKPAAVALPLSLFLLDFWRGRSQVRAVWLEKVPFLLLALFFGILTVSVQAEKALVSIEKYTLFDRFFFGCYGLVQYARYFFFPAPLSAFHPYPKPGELGLWIHFSPIVLLAMAGALWYFRRNKALLFGALFYVANIILVVQFIAIGNTLLSERYTYVPYIGLAFALSMVWTQAVRQPWGKQAQWWVTLLALLVWGYLSRERVAVWENSETLWSDAVLKYPEAPLPHSNRANYLYELAMKPANAGRSQDLMQRALADCDSALASNPGHFAALDIRSIIYLRLVRYDDALSDANTMIAVKPGDIKGYVVRGSAYEHLKRYDEALADYSHCLELDPNNTEALNGRGTVLFNGKKQYREALADFDRAIALKPDGSYYLNRSRCYYMLGDRPKARENALNAQRVGTMVAQDYLDAINR